MKRPAITAAVVLATLMGVWLLWQFHDAVVLFILSLALAATLRPLVDRQVARGWPRHISLLSIYGLALGLLFVVVWSLAGPLLNDLRLVADNFVLTYDRIFTQWPSGTGFQQAVARLLPAPTELYNAIAGPRGEAMIQGLLGVTVNLLGVLSNVVVVLVMSLYWGVDQARFERLWLSVLPAELRARAREIWRAMETGVGAYIRSEVTQSLLAGLLLGLGYWTIGLKYPALLALGSALAWLIPWLGAVLALGPVLLVGWTSGPGVAVLAGVYTVVVLLALELWIEPRLYNRRQYNSLLVVLAVMMMGEAYGVLGLLAAPPLAAAVQILLTHLITPSSTPASQPVENQFVVLAERLTSVRAALATAPVTPGPQIVNLVDRLEALLDKVGGVLQEEDQLGRAWVPPKVRTVPSLAEGTGQSAAPASLGNKG